MMYRKLPHSAVITRQFAKAKKEGEIRRKQMAYEEEEKKLKRAEIDRCAPRRRQSSLARSSVSHAFQVLLCMVSYSV